MTAQFATRGRAMDAAAGWPLKNAPAVTAEMEPYGNRAPGQRRRTGRGRWNRHYFDYVSAYRELYGAENATKVEDGE